MLKVGLKLWTTNVRLLEQAQIAFDRGMLDFVELYVVPGTVESHGSRWAGLGGPVVLHAPHSSHGFNLADPLLKETNRDLFAETQILADRLRTQYIVVHGGSGGQIGESIDQLRALNEPRIAIENKPFLGLNGKECIGHTAAQIQRIMESCRLNKFILDLNHAVHAARSLRYDPIELIRHFLDLHPTGFHLADGDPDSETDMHMSLGHGRMPLREMVPLMPNDAAVTLETPLSPERGLDDFFMNKSVLLSFTKQGCAHE